MRLTLFAAGSQGDIQPCVVLGKHLQQAGFQVLLAAPQNFADFVRGHDLRFHPLRGDVQQIMAGETGRRFMETGGSNPIQSIFSMRKMIGPIARQMAEDALEACGEAEALISLAVFATLASTIAELRSLPLLNIEPTPVVPTGDFPAAGFPVQRNLGRMFNRVSGFAMVFVIWQWYRPFVNEFRIRFGLRPLSSADFHRLLTSTPLLGAYSPQVIPPPLDWPDTVHITGYWFQDNQPEWHPSWQLESFLDKGEAPVYIGFGSMAGRDPERFADIALRALEQSGRRGVLATGWGGMNVLKVPDTVLVIDSAPHDWLFPRMAAVVHHGGAGTTAEGLRAGVPTVVVPFIADQPFWGKRIKALGIGPKPIPAKKLTADKLAAAIRAATTDPTMKTRAATLGQAIRSERGVENAVRLVQEHLGA
jgi:UDP:flavonoid glycosyltransferase YjiC (YdhE family)